LEELGAAWRRALDAADRALDAANRDLADAELGAHRSSLKNERAATAGILQQVATLHGNRDQFVSLLVPRSQLKPMLGVPLDVQAFVFNLEGVLIGSADAHAAAWSETLDEFIHTRVERTHGQFAPFNPRVDYPLHIHGRPRLDGVRAFLASRGIRLPEGRSSDPPGAETVYGLANRKNQALIRHLREHGVTAFAGARRYLELAREVGVRTAVVSASSTTRRILRDARLEDLIDSAVDGNVIVTERLELPPAPDVFLLASQNLEVDPARTAVFETSHSGIEAARSAAFGYVVGVGRGDQAEELRTTGADVVVADLADLLNRRLSARTKS